MARTLQQQGVPIKSNLRGPRAKTPQSQPRPVRKTVRQRTPLDGRMGGTQDSTTYYSYDDGESRTRKSRNTRLSRYNPGKAGGDIAGGVGGLEAEFLLAIVLLILLMFANSTASYGDRIMSLMKRGALTCLLFFVLSLIASTGPNASRIAKAFGALIIVAILITSPTNTVLTDIDSLIKNDWVPTTEHASSTSADSGTQASTQSPPSTSNLGSDFLNALENELNLQGQKTSPSNNPVSKASITTDVKNALTSTLNGIIPGSGSILSKLGF
jgi:hypothetical protein